MGQPRDYYRILHVHPDAPVEIIRSSYRTLMQRLKKHPDLGGDNEDAALINKAYATLTDPAKRAEYDEQRHSRPNQKKKRENKSPSKRHKSTDLSWNAYRGAGLGYCGFCAAAHDQGMEAPQDALCDSCASPMHRAQRHDIVPSERQRALERIPKRQNIRFYTHWPDSSPSAGRTRDISLDGMLFDTNRSLVVNQMIKIDCDACRAVARVAHVQSSSGAWVVGVEFVTLRFERVQGTFVSAQV